MLTCLHILRGMEHRGVALADDLSGLIAVETPRAFVPQEALPLQVFADDGIFGGGFQNVLEEGRKLPGALAKQASCGLVAFARLLFRWAHKSLASCFFAKCFRSVVQAMTLITPRTISGALGRGVTSTARTTLSTASKWSA